MDYELTDTQKDIIQLAGDRPNQGQAGARSLR